MQQNNPFNSANSSISKRQNPRTMMENFESDRQRYKSVRVHPEDFKFLRAHAFYNEMNIIDVVSLGVKLIKEQKAKELEHDGSVESNQA